MDTRFSSAIHMLTLVAEAEKPMTSDEIAASVGTNASYIRKIAGLLKKGGIIESCQGIRGFSLAAPPERLTLYMIYQSVYDSDRIHVFDLHQNPNDECIVGRYIQPVLTDTFREIEEKAERELKAQTLADCIDRIRTEINMSDLQ